MNIPKPFDGRVVLHSRQGGKWAVVELRELPVNGSVLGRDLACDFTRRTLAREWAEAQGYTVVK